MKPEIIFDIILVVIGLYLALFKSYFQEKGKNLATSEDLEDLTLKVESVKQNFIEKSASLKAKLDLLTNLQISHKNDERNSLIEFHKSIKSWISLLTESSPALVDYYDNQEIQNKIHLYDLTYSKVLNVEALLELYVDDKELNQLIFNLKKSILEHLVPHPAKFLLDLKLNNFEYDQLEKMSAISIEDITEKKEKYNELLEKRKRMLDKRKGLFDEYRTNMIKGYGEVIGYDRKYQFYIREYIKKIAVE